MIQWLKDFSCFVTGWISKLLNESLELMIQRQIFKQSLVATYWPNNILLEVSNYFQKGDLIYSIITESIGVILQQACDSCPLISEPRIGIDFFDSIDQK